MLVKRLLSAWMLLMGLGMANEDRHLIFTCQGQFAASRLLLPSLAQGSTFLAPPSNSPLASRVIEDASSSHFATISPSRQQIELWRLDGQRSTSMDVAPRTVARLKFNPQATLLASLYDDGTLDFWYTSGSKLVAHRPDVVAVTDVIFAPQAPLVGIRTKDGVVHIAALRADMSASTERKEVELFDHLPKLVFFEEHVHTTIRSSIIATLGSDVRSFAFSANGELLALYRDEDIVITSVSSFFDDHVAYRRIANPLPAGDEWNVLVSNDARWNVIVAKHAGEIRVITEWGESGVKVPGILSLSLGESLPGAVILTCLTTDHRLLTFFIDESSQITLIQDVTIRDVTFERSVLGARKGLL